MAAEATARILDAQTSLAVERTKVENTEATLALERVRAEADIKNAQRALAQANEDSRAEIDRVVAEGERNMLDLQKRFADKENELAKAMVTIRAVSDYYHKCVLSHVFISSAGGSGIR